MSLRFRLAVAFFLLSALPLATFAVYSYISSRTALEEAAHAETAQAANELERRVAVATADIDRRLQALAAVPVETWVSSSPDGEPRLAPAVAGLSEALPFLSELRFVPRPPPPRATPVGAAVAVVPAVPPPPEAPAIAATVRRTLGAIGNGAELAGRIAELQGATKLPKDFALEIERIRAAALEATRVAREQRAAAVDRQRVEHEVERIVEQGKRIEAETKHLTVPVGTSEEDELVCEVSDGDRVVGQLRAQIHARQLFESTLARVDRSRGEVPFALAEGGTLLTRTPEDRERLARVPAIAELRGATVPADAAGHWVVVARRDPSTGYQLGIARPLSPAISELRAAAARNFALGMGLVGIALVGFFPLTHRIVRDVRDLERGAQRLADGDLTARVAARGRDELGRLAGAFNRMAEQIAAHQDRLLAEERRRKEEEIQRALLAAENERRGRELEEAREFQLSLLPRELPRREGLDLAVSMTTATEVGGDYYDFLLGPQGELILAVGDATGHGAAAGTLVTAVKGLFAGGADRCSPAEFLGSANAAIHRMGLVRRAMALTVACLEGSRLRISAAGMPPALRFRAADERIEEIVLPGMPLGARSGVDYEERALELAPGDALLFLTDGLPELPNAAGEPFGYERLGARFATLARGAAGEIVAGLEEAVGEWGGGATPADDVTFLVLKARAI
jgi:serine phosphatase RsbU (regulator of sigma subunit)